MANRELNTIKLQIGGTLKDLRNDFGFVCTEGPSYTPLGKAKQLSSNMWFDEDGADTYIPRKMFVEAGGLKIPIGYQGARGSGKAVLKALVLWLLGRGGDELTSEGIYLYSAFIDEGFRKVTFSEISEPEYHYLGDFELLEATITFNIPDPLDNVTFDGGRFVVEQ